MFQKNKTCCFNYQHCSAYRIFHKMFFQKNATLFFLMKKHYFTSLRKIAFAKVAVTILLCFAGTTAIAQGGNGLWQAIGNDTVTTNRQVAVTKNMVVYQM